MAKSVLDYLNENSPESVVIKEFESAIVGVAENSNGIICVYDRQKAVSILTEGGMSADDAEEYFEYNTIRSLPYMGELAPVFIMEI